MHACEQDEYLQTQHRIDSPRGVVRTRRQDRVVCEIHASSFQTTHSSLHCCGALIRVNKSVRHWPGWPAAALAVALCISGARVRCTDECKDWYVYLTLQVESNVDQRLTPVSSGCESFCGAAPWIKRPQPTLVLHISTIEVKHISAELKSMSSLRIQARCNLQLVPTRLSICRGWWTSFRRSLM